METPTVEPNSAMPENPQKEHQWLQKLVGEWTYETEVRMESEHSIEKATGTEHVRSLGGLWIVAEGQGEMPGCGAATTIMTIGYNPKNQRFMGTWVGSMMTYLWLYDGELDASGNSLILYSDGPSMSGEDTLAKYKDVIELKSNNHRVMTSHVLNNDGQWHQFMTVNYHRR